MRVLPHVSTAKVGVGLMAISRLSMGKWRCLLSPCYRMVRGEGGVGWGGAGLGCSEVGWAVVRTMEGPCHCFRKSGAPETSRCPIRGEALSPFVMLLLFCSILVWFFSVLKEQLPRATTSPSSIALLNQPLELQETCIFFFFLMV